MQDVSEIATKFGIPLNIFSRLVWNESRGNKAVGWNSDRTSAGLTQITSDVWKKYNKSIPFSRAGDTMYYKTNLITGAKYLVENYKRFGNWTDAMMAYNMGPTAFAKVQNGMRNVPKITKNYVKGI